MVDPAHVEPVDRAFIGVQSIGEIADRRKRERAGEAKRAIPIGWSEGSGRGHRCLMWRSEEHTSELQSLMRISYAVFCLKKKNTQKNTKRHSLYDTQHSSQRHTQYS